jgi:hypothetical protein
MQSAFYKIQQEDGRRSGLKNARKAEFQFVQHILEVVLTIVIYQVAMILLKGIVSRD